MSNSDPTPFRLHVLGAPDLRAPDGRRITSVLSQPKRLGLLTYLALAERPVTRASLVALFWPESDETHARNALSQAVFYLRRSLDEHVVQSVEGDRLWAPPEHLWCDARERLAGNGAAGPGRGGVANPEVGGPAVGELLDGWNADDSQELQEWLDTQRRRLRERAATRASLTAPPTAPQLRSSTVRAIQLPTVLAVAALVALLATMALVRYGRPGPTEVPMQSLVVLMPQVSATPGAPPIDPAVVHAEVLASLSRVDGIRIVSAMYAGSLRDFRRQLRALGVEPIEVPRWILEVNIRATGDEARVVGLLHRSPAFDLPGSVSFDVTYGGAEAALLDAPRLIAQGVSGMVARVLAEEREGS